ncbi:tyrosyl-DNA phosphodiesterase-domain-containing protein [Massariosphaeria phaeospora]|uniref:Tyrosyl-DNA phosphodiesterase-domain-containing protein n=1 Tax=Massariosphaeria phaeospora TaxID=100035 RepID=A0A7C8HYS4_9PLEO|nr:tyrosyl-DNA phosphodiesterase-domain-containing protein [Massariosphaeria phaeospora]
MASLDDDAELKRAIALSLEDASSSKSALAPERVVDLSSDDDDDEDLRRAMALSLQENEAEKPSISASAHKPQAPAQSQYALNTSLSADRPAQNSPDAITTKPASGVLGLDRKAMEQERLARLGKRKRSASPDRPSKLIAKALPAASASSAHQPPIADKSPIQYPGGIIKRTWAFKHPRTNDIRLEEVLQASTVNIAILSSFQWEDSWLFDKLDPCKVKQIWIMNGKYRGEDVREKMQREAVEAQIPNFKQHFPPMDGQISNMHSKFMLLFHPTHLRIAVPTANMTLVDWGETNKDPRTGKSWQPAVMENSVFLIDLPRRSDNKLSNKEDLSSFGKELLRFLEAQEVGRNVIEGLLKFDFTHTQHSAFVHSIAGNHTGEASHQTGLAGLARAVRHLQLDQVETLELDCTASSLGALKDTFLKQVYLAARGASPLSDETIPARFLDKIRIYFPSRDTVEKSTGGPACAGIVTLSKSHYGADFPKQCMRDYKSTRRGVLSHNKLLLARGRKKDGTSFAWAYIGSANLSEAAWGSQKVLKSGKQSVLINRNWECGVLVPVPEDSLKDLQLQDGEVPPMSVFEGTIEVPFQYPGEEYGAKEPWFFK